MYSATATHLYDVMDSVVIGVANVHPNGFEDHPIAIGPSLDAVGIGDHGVSGTAHRAGLGHAAA